MKAEVTLALCAVLLGACVSDEPAGAPEPIGEELLSFTTALGIPGCAEGHLYRARESVQYQCFSTRGAFSWENRGTLTMEARAELEAALAAADTSDATPSEGDMCEGSEQDSATVTLWAEGRSVSFPPNCPPAGVTDVHDLLMTLLGDIGDCAELDMLASVEPGCRAY